MKSLLLFCALLTFSSSYSKKPKYNKQTYKETLQEDVLAISIPEPEDDDSVPATASWDRMQEYLRVNAEEERIAQEKKKQRFTIAWLLTFFYRR